MFFLFGERGELLSVARSCARLGGGRWVPNVCQSLSINITRTDVGEHVLPEEAQLAVPHPADFLLEGSLPSCIL